MSGISFSAPTACLLSESRASIPVTTVDSGVFDTSQGTVHLVLGSGGGATSAGTARVSVPEAGDATVARVITRPSPPVPDPRVPVGSTQQGTNAMETATWSARRDAWTGYGIAVFDVSPGSEAGGQTSITVRWYQAVGAELVGPTTGAADDYTLFETFPLVRPRSDGRRWHPKG